MAEVTCTGETAHFDNGCELAKHYDKDNDGIIRREEVLKATQDHEAGILADEEITFVVLCYLHDGRINAICPGCYAAETGVLAITTTPAGATIKVTRNGTLYEELSPLWTELPPGTYTVEVSKAGYETITDTVTITAGITTTKSYTLTAETVATTFASIPTGAKIYIDDVLTGTT